MNKTIISSTDGGEFEIEKARQQLTGFLHALDGFGVVSLVKSMGLKESEWEQIRMEEWIPLDIVEEVDTYFALYE